MAGDSAVASESRLFVGAPFLAAQLSLWEHAYSQLVVPGNTHRYAVPALSDRLSAGQIPSGIREEQLWGLFSPYGVIRNLHLLKGFDSKPRGCAMVLFARWSQAESAAEALNGKTGQLLGQTRPLVVHFANPRRSPQGPPEPGIAPRKLFVGQVSGALPALTHMPVFRDPTACACAASVCLWSQRGLGCSDLELLSCVSVLVSYSQARPAGAAV